jgi:sugar phosphate isomerase/epimerase
MVLTAYGWPHLMGYLATKSGEKVEAPLGLTGLMDAAEEMGLSGIEAHLPSAEPSAVAALADELRARNLTMVADTHVLVDQDVGDLRTYLKAAPRLGTRVVRAMLSGVLCGDRRKLAGGWEERMERSAAVLRELLPLAEDLGIAIAIENHQDATSDDLLRLAEMSGNSPAYGVTLDTGNPLAVGEDPVEFAQRVAHLIRHVHLKDYTIHFAPEGYRLVRCIAGTGVIDFPKILDIVGGNGHKVTPGIEVAAQQTRTIPLLEEGWWAHYPPKAATQLIGPLRILWERGRPAHQPYSSAWERGADSAAVCAEERAVVYGSAAYFRGLAGVG